MALVGVAAECPPPSMFVQCKGYGAVLVDVDGVLENGRLWLADVEMQVAKEVGTAAMLLPSRLCFSSSVRRDTRSVARSSKEYAVLR